MATSKFIASEVCGNQWYTQQSGLYESLHQKRMTTREAVLTGILGAKDTRSNKFISQFGFLVGMQFLSVERDRDY